MRSPVLFIVFNRPDPTRRVFEAIRSARPSRLYVAADGPREGRATDFASCEEARRIATAVDWPCEIKTLFREKNLGCRFAPQNAIDWFFENEEEGIILEDDCLPHPDFFIFCDWALAEYRSDKSVWHVNGNNFACPDTLFGAGEVDFTALAQVWGWASWRDRWRFYEGNPYYLMEKIEARKSEWLISPIAKINKISHVRSLQRGLDAWDFQWQATILNNRGLCVSNKSNLICNLGDGVDATHTQNDDRICLQTRAISGSLEHVQPTLNPSLNRWYEDRMGMRRSVQAGIYVSRVIFDKIKTKVRNVLACALFFGLKPIVVASTGRSGSTLLFEAIAESLVFNRFGLLPDSKAGQFVIGLAKAYSIRLPGVAGSCVPVHKTHDVFDAKYAGAAKYIFVYGDPLESARSVELMLSKHGRIWLDEHLYNLNSSGQLEELFLKDILGYENQITSWLDKENASVLGVHFDELWDRKEEISRYAGFDVGLPAQRMRAHKQMLRCFNGALFERLANIMLKYKSTRMKIG